MDVLLDKIGFNPERVAEQPPSENSIHNYLLYYLILLHDGTTKDQITIGEITNDE